MAAENNERYLRGKEVLARVEQNPHGSILDSLASFSPDLERFVVEFGYADVFDREGLSDQARQLITISCLLYTSPSPRDRQKSRMPSSA